jgi:methyl coenzyme M reductase alpha subunit
VTGQSFRKDEHTALLILNTFAMDQETDGFIRGVLVGQQTTHDYLKQTFHDTVSQQVMAATFAVEMLRGKLEGDAVANSKEVTAISTLLQSLFTDIQTALNFQPAYPSGDRPSEN